MDMAQARQRLQEEQRRLQDVQGAADRLVTGAIEADAAELSHVDQHPADSASETLEREIDTSVAQQVQAALADVEAALGRIDAATYGICEVCGKPIGDARLEVMPAARYCVDDQARAERDPSLRQQG